MARECWAKSLGDCQGGISREHPLSECVFPDQNVFVSGFDFCGGGTKEVSINSLTAKILCRKHNARLGKQVDPVGGQLFEVARSFTKRRKQQSDFPDLNWLPLQYQIDARLLERWFLKVMLGIGFGGSLVIGSEGSEAGIVPPQLVRIAFGLEEFPIGQGMYVAFKKGETYLLEDHFRYTAKAIGRHLLMGFFNTHGFRFYLNLEPTGGAVYGSIEDSEVFYREAHFVETPPHRYALIRRCFQRCNAPRVRLLKSFRSNDFLANPTFHSCESGTGDDSSRADRPTKAPAVHHPTATIQR